METGHAFLCRGTQGDVPAVIARMSAATPAVDLVVRAFADMGIDDARDIRERAVLRGVGGDRLFVICASSITAEAQNALLKTFEEPLAGARFVLVVPSPESLLPTLRSRTQILTLERRPHAVSPIDVATFLSSQPATRIDMLKPLTAAEEKDTAGTLAFLAALERALADQDKKDAGALGALYMARGYILDKGALRKSLLEQLALLLPVLR